MTGIESFDEVARELAHIIQSGDAALVIGAGASVTSGAPISSVLVEQIRARFPIASIRADASFLDAGSEVCDTPPYGRLQLVSWLRDILGSLEPASEYKQLPRAKWRAIFTTNYDDLVEKAYQSPARVQTVQPVHLPYEGNELPRDGHVLLFYLQGSIKEKPEGDGSPVVSRSDYLHTVQIRQATMDTFRNVIARGGSVIYLGYSFGDQFLDDLLDEANRRLGNRNMPYGYAIVPEWPTNRSGAAARMARRNITPVEGTFEQFAGLIEKVLSDPVPHQGTRVTPAPAAGRTIALSTGTVKMTEADAGVQSESFELLSEELLRQQPLGAEEESHVARRFLKGEFFGWTPFVRGWAFKRAAYPDALEAVHAATASDLTGHDRIVLVHGPAGLGKTIMSYQLATDLYKQSGYVVLRAKAAWRARPDLNALQRVLDDIERDIPDGGALPPVVLIVDEAELLEHSVALRVVRQGKSSGRTVVVLLLARTNEYFRVDTQPDRRPPEKWGDPIAVALSESISEGEVRSLVAHVKRLKLWSPNRVTDEHFWIAQVKTQYDASFFDTVFSLVEDTQEPLTERVWSEYEHLGELAREAYVLIAATHQFGLPLRMEMLVRALGVSFAEFDAAVIRSDAREILFSDYDTNELNLFFRARTRIISAIIFSRALPDKSQQLEQFIRIVRSTSGSVMFGTQEVDMVRNLLVQVLGPSGFDHRFDTEQQGRLFAEATAVIEDDVLEHHFGLIEKDAGRFEAAKTHLEKALRLRGASIAPRESEQNVQTSLGQVLQELAFEALRAREATKSAELFEQAGAMYLSARGGERPNVAAYDAHARMLVRRAKAQHEAGTMERGVALAEAVDVLSAGIDNVSDDGKAELRELRATVLENLGLGDAAVAELKHAASGLPPRARARYELMIARLLSGWGSADRNKKLRQALPHAAAATELDPEYFDAWRTRAELFIRLNPKDFAGARELLEQALRCEGALENNWVLYELAVANFYLERYDDSAKLFKRLRRASRGNSAAIGVLETAGERNGDTPFEYEGRIVQSDVRRGASIECAELRAFGPVWFNADRQRSYTPRLYDRASCEIAFNYRGVLATEVRKI